MPPPLQLPWIPKPDPGKAKIGIWESMPITRDPIWKELHDNTLFESGMNAVKGAGEGLLDLGTGFAQMVNQSALNIMQAAGPAPIEGATDPYVEMKGGQVLQGLVDRTYNASKSGLDLFFGLGSAWDQRMRQRAQIMGQPATPSAYVKDVGKTLYDTVTKDIIPFESLKQVITGRDADGKPLSIEERSRMLVPSVAQAAMVGHAVQRGITQGGVLERIKTKTANMEAAADKLVTTGDLKEMWEGKMGTVGRPVGAPPESAILTDPNAPLIHNPVSELIKGTTPYRILHEPELDDVTSQALASGVMMDAFTRSFTGDEGGRMHDVLMQTIESGGIDPTTVRRMMSDFNITAPDAASALRDSVDATAKNMGGSMAVLSRAKAMLEANLIHNAITLGDPESVTALQRMLKQHATTQTNRAQLAKMGMAQRAWHEIRSTWQAAEDLGRGIIVSLPKTAARNAQGQGAMYGLSFVDHYMTGLVELMSGAPEQGSIGNHFADAATQSLSLFDALHNAADRARQMTGIEALQPGPRQSFIGDYLSVLDKFPTLKLQVTADYGSEVVRSTANHITFRNARAALDNPLRTDLTSGPLQKGVNRGLDLAGAAMTDFGEVLEQSVLGLNTLNQMQEYGFRVLNSSHRLDTNLRRMGWADVMDDNGNLQKTVLQQAADMADNPQAPTELRQAMMDSFDHGMEMTLARTPRTGEYGRWIIDAYSGLKKALPPTAVLPKFPRFLVNQWRYITEHSPVHLFDLFDPKLRKVLSEGSDNMFVDRDAREAIGKAITGTMMLGSAYALRRSELRGPNYYELTDPSTGKAYDARPYQPFTQYLGIAALLDEALNKTPSGMSANEALDFLAGVRRLTDVPTFAFVDWLRDMNSSNEETKTRAMEKSVGQYLGQFFRGFEFLSKDLTYIATGDSSIIAQKDPQGNELLAPSMQSFAGDTTPVKISPWTGHPMVSQAPISEMLGSLRGVEKTRLQQYVEKIGFEPTQIIPNLGHPALDRQFAIEMGKTLSNPAFNHLVDILEKQPFKPEVKELIIAETLSEVRKDTLEKVQEYAQTDPLLAGQFAKRQIQSAERLPSAWKESLKAELHRSIPGLRIR